MLDPSRVAIRDTGTLSYPQTPPYHPSQAYPEYPLGEGNIGAENLVYDGIRGMFKAWGLDAQAVDTPQWNPLGELVEPGNTVILKPNFVVSEHPLGQPGIDAAVVHGSVLRALIDYVYIALKGEGRIVVADSPIKEVDFDKIIELTGIAGVADFYNRHTQVGVELLDFRDVYVRRNEDGFMVDLQPLPGDPTGYTLVDLGDQSMFHEVMSHRHRLRSTAVYYENVMGEFHNAAHNIYSVPNTLLNADVVISVAKLKTHRKGGVTLSMKNAVGITNEKRGLPHHRVGSPKEGGDAYADNARWDARFEDAFRDTMLSHPSGRLVLKVLGGPLRFAAKNIKPFLRRANPGQPDDVEGDWYGNDTVWRMALDLNHVLFFSDKNGALQKTPQRRYLSVIDGVIAGEGEGPLFPTPKPCGILLAGFHPVVVDLVGARLMGFDWAKVPMLREAWRRDWPLRPAITVEQVSIESNRQEWRELLTGQGPGFAFQPSRGWQGHVELKE